MEEFRYNIGQRVHIVEERPVRCAPGWASDMDKFFGKEATITEHRLDTGWYRIDLDRGEWYWAEDYFQETFDSAAEEVYPDDKEIDSAMERLFEGISVRRI